MLKVSRSRKKNCGAVNSPKKQTDKFVFLSCTVVRIENKLVSSFFGRIWVSTIWCRDLHTIFKKIFSVCLPHHFLKIFFKGSGQQDLQQIRKRRRVLTSIHWPPQHVDFQLKNRRGKGFISWFGFVDFLAYCACCSEMPFSSLQGLRKIWKSGGSTTNPRQF